MNDNFQRVLMGLPRQEIKEYDPKVVSDMADRMILHEKLKQHLVKVEHRDDLDFLPNATPYLDEQIVWLKEFCQRDGHFSEDEANNLSDMLRQFNESLERGEENETAEFDVK